PASATARVRDHASRSGYNLRVVDAGEFSDPRYRANPVNRCYFCKSNLYSTLVALHEGTVLSGTNTDDLGDYRPGLIAASEQRVRHPYVEADIDKSTVRAIARHLGLDDIADLPSAPCLASRITTGLRVEAEDLKLIDRIEMSLRARLPTASDIRCRKSYTGWIVQLDQQTLSAVGGGNIETLVTEVFAGTGMASGDRVRITAYERGSAFVHAGSSEHDADAAELP
ncbi:MAG: adenine nucleotide alpha hydrolase, partial [Pseudomonadota bacterium]